MSNCCLMGRKSQLFKALARVLFMGERRRRRRRQKAPSTQLLQRRAAAAKGCRFGAMSNITESWLWRRCVAGLGGLTALLKSLKGFYGETGVGFKFLSRVHLNDHVTCHTGTCDNTHRPQATQHNESGTQRPPPTHAHPHKQVKQHTRARACVCGEGCVAGDSGCARRSSGRSAAQRCAAAAAAAASAPHRAAHPSCCTRKHWSV